MPRDVEDAVEVHVDDLVPVLRCELLQRCSALQAGIVHQDVGGAVLLDDLFESGADGLHIGHVEVCAEGRTPGPVLHLAASSLHRGGVPPVDDDARAGAGEHLGEGSAQPAGRSCDQGEAAGDVEQLRRQGGGG